jgi:hypothetical protein
VQSKRLVGPQRAEALNPLRESENTIAARADLKRSGVCNSLGCVEEEEEEEEQMKKS